MKKFLTNAIVLLTVFAFGCAAIPDGKKSGTAQASQEPKKDEVVSKTLPQAESPVSQPLVSAKAPSWLSLELCNTKTGKAKGYLPWKKYGGDPFQGSPEQAIAQSGWPKDAKTAGLKEIKKGDPTKIVLKRGDTLDWMAFGRLLKGGKAKVRKNVIVCWKEGETHEADAYSFTVGGREYKLYKPSCGNWSGRSVPEEQVDKPKNKRAPGRTALADAGEIPVETAVAVKPEAPASKPAVAEKTPATTEWKTVRVTRISDGVVYVPVAQGAVSSYSSVSLGVCSGDSWGCGYFPGALGWGFGGGGLSSGGGLIYSESGSVAPNTAFPSMGGNGGGWNQIMPGSGVTTLPPAGVPGSFVRTR